MILVVDGRTVTIENAAQVALPEGCGQWHGPGVAWSPDGSTVAFMDLPGEREAALILLDGDSHARRTLLTWDVPWQQAAAWQISWSPDGSKMVVGPHLIDIATGRVLTKGPFGGTASWSADGRRLVVVDYTSLSFFGTELLYLDTAELVWTNLGTGRFVDFLPDGDVLVMRWPEGERLSSTSPRC